MASYNWVEVGWRGRWYVGRNGRVYESDGWSDILGFLQRLQSRTNDVYRKPVVHMRPRRPTAASKRVSLPEALEIVEEKMVGERLREAFS